MLSVLGLGLIFSRDSKQNLVRLRCKVLDRKFCGVLKFVQPANLICSIQVFFKLMETVD